MILLRSALDKCKSEILKRMYFIGLMINEDLILSPPKTTINIEH